MTERIKGFTVTLEKPMRIDDIDRIITAISMIRGIANVEPSIDTSSDHMNREMIKNEMRMKFHRYVEEQLK